MIAACPGAIATQLAAYPSSMKLRVILNHTSYPMDRSPDALRVWRRGMEALADCANVACKISGLPVLGAPFTLEANKPIILDTISMFGVERCMFASNFPVDGLKGSWDYIYTTYKRSVADLDPRDQEKLFAEHALKFYRIDLPV